MPEADFEADIMLVNTCNHKWLPLDRELVHFSPYKEIVRQRCRICNIVRKGTTYDQYKEPDSWEYWPSSDTTKS